MHVVINNTQQTFITGPPTHSIGGQTSNGRWRLLSSVTLHSGPTGGFTRAGQAVTHAACSLIIAPR